MTNQIDKIVEKLPQGLTESGIEEVATLIDSVVEERVSEEVKILEAKVKAFLRTKLHELKETARHELEADNNVVRAHKVFEAIKTIVAAEIEGEDVNSVVAQYEGQANELSDENNLLKGKLEESARINGLLEKQVARKASELKSLNEALVNEKEQADKPFKSSESAVMITNETHGTESISDSARDNFFLNEDVIRLSQLIKTTELE